MSDLFKVDLQRILGEMDQAPPLEEWADVGLLAMSVLAQVGILERLELLIKLQALSMSTNLRKRDEHILTELAEVLDHFGWEKIT